MTQIRHQEDITAELRHQEDITAALGDTFNQLLTNLEDLSSFESSSHIPTACSFESSLHSPTACSFESSSHIPTALKRDLRDFMNMSTNSQNVSSLSKGLVSNWDSGYWASGELNVGDDEASFFHFSRKDFEQVAQILGRSLLSRDPGYQDDFYCPDDEDLPDFDLSKLVNPHEEDLPDFDLSKLVNTYEEDLPDFDLSKLVSPPSIYSSTTDLPHLLNPISLSEPVNLIGTEEKINVSDLLEAKQVNLFEEEKGLRLSEADLPVEPTHDDEDLFSRMDQLFETKKAEKIHNGIPKDTMVEKMSLQNNGTKEDIKEFAKKWDYILEFFRRFDPLCAPEDLIINHSIFIFQG